MISPAARLSADAPMQQSPIPAKTVTVSPTGPNLQFANKSKEDREASMAYKSYAYSNTTPVQSPQAVYTQSPAGGGSKTPAAGTKDAREAAAAAAPANTDWIGLAIRVSGIYTLIKNLL
jgi:hypothetical protein